MAMANRTLTPNIQFQYAWCLVRTDNKHNLQTGANLLEGITDSNTQLFSWSIPFHIDAQGSLSHV